METDRRYYIYLISSLPMLHFGLKPPLSFARFISLCSGLIPQEELELLEIIGSSGTLGLVSVKHPMLKKFNEFEKKLRNELVRIRAGRKRVDASIYLRDGDYADHYLYQIALHAYRNPSPLDGEKILDQERWRFLDELSGGHYFDFDILLIYALKLSILGKWHRIYSADRDTLIEAALKR